MNPTIIWCLYFLLISRISGGAEDDNDDDDNKGVSHAFQNTKRTGPTRPARSSRATQPFQAPVTDSPECPYKDGGESFKINNMRHCFADCLDLIEDSQFGSQCKYNPFTLNVVGEKCQGRFLPNTTSEKKIFCSLDNFMLKDHIGGANESNATQWMARSMFCTHILVYPLVKFDENSKKVQLMQDQYAKFLPHIDALRPAGLKILATIGNWFEAGTLTISPKLFSSIARNGDQRDNFVKDVIAIVEKLNLDGVNIRWTFPSSPLSVSDGPLADKDNYVTLLRNFSTILKPKGLILTTEGSANKNILLRGIDLPKVIAAVDYYLLFASDYHGTWMIVTGLSTPNKEVRSTIEFYKTKVDDLSKVILYLRGSVAMFELTKTNINAALGSFANIDKKSEIPWFQLMKKIYLTEKNKWLVTKGTVDSQPFACNGDKWVSFDDINAIKYRAELVKSFGLGGIYQYSIFDDDLNNELGCGESPFVRTINEIIRGYDDCVLPTCP